MADLMASSSAAAASPSDAAAPEPVAVPAVAPAAAAAEANPLLAPFDVVKPKMSLTETIRKLKEEQNLIRIQKAEITKTLRNATKKKNRLKKRARQLTDLDLVEVLQMRQDVNAAASSSEPAATPSPPQSEPAAGTGDEHDMSD